MDKQDTIYIKDQKISCFIGVPDEERKTSQELLISCTMVPRVGFETVADDIDLTIDYHAVSLRIEEVAQKHERKLIETLAEDIAHTILEEFEVGQVSIKIKKFILPNTSYVGVSITRDHVN